MRSHPFRFAEQGGAILSPWSTVLLLALESSEVIGLRVAKLAGGGVDAQYEADLIVSEKVDAVIEVTASFMSGAAVTKVINRFREQVAANTKRLSAENCRAMPSPTSTVAENCHSPRPAFERVVPSIASDRLECDFSVGTAPYDGTRSV
jgi:hypothetical protein